MTLFEALYGKVELPLATASRKHHGFKMVVEKTSEPKRLSEKAMERREALKKRHADYRDIEQTKALDFIKRNPGCTSHKLAPHLFWSYSKTTKLMRTLYEAGKIKRKKVMAGGLVKRPVFGYEVA